MAGVPVKSAPKAKKLSSGLTLTRGSPPEPLRMTVVVTLALFPAVLDSGEVVRTVAVSLVDDAVGVEFTLTFKVKLAVAFGERDRKVAFTVPVPPTAGVDRIQPAGAVKDSKVVWTGTGSVRVTFKALLSPLPLFRVMLYVTIPPGLALLGEPLTVTVRFVG